MNRLAETLETVASEEAASPDAPAIDSAVAEAPAPDLAPELQPVVETPHIEVPNGRPYEITFIVKANDPAALESTQAKVNSLVVNSGGAVDNVRVSEVRRLAYPIAKQTDGVYVVINARFEKSLTEELERYFKIEENVLRHILLRENA